MAQFLRPQCTGINSIKSFSDNSLHRQAQNQANPHSSMEIRAALKVLPLPRAIGNGWLLMDGESGVRPLLGFSMLQWVISLLIQAALIVLSEL